MKNNLNIIFIFKYFAIFVMNIKTYTNDECSKNNKRRRIKII